jgi:flagellar protein FliO/FliZ
VKLTAYALGAGCLAGTTAQAAAAPVAPAGGGTTAFASLLQTTLSLLLVLAVILALAWVARRLKLTPLHRSAELSVLADVAVGPKERVVLLKVGSRQALVGVGADGVRGLSLLETSVEIRPVAEVETSFAARLAEAMKSGARK